MNLNTLLVFVKVAEANSFSEGARRLKAPVSTVSRQIAEFEAQLGARLLERSTRRLKLTEIGVKVLEQARTIVDIKETVQNITSSRSSRVSGLLRISVPLSIADPLVAPLVGAFQASHPEVRIHVTVSDRPADLMADGFHLMFKIGPMKDSCLVARKILTFRDRLVASPSYLQTCMPLEGPNDLLAHRILAFSCSDAESEWSFVQPNKQEGITLRIEPVLSANDPARLVNALLAGMGIGNVPSIICDRLIEKRELVELMPQWRFRTLDVWIIHASKRQVLPSVHEFTRFAAKMAPAFFPRSLSADREHSTGAEMSAFESLATLPQDAGPIGRPVLAAQTADTAAA
jgi:DNA-binding transcriptional LysR family regulator